MIDLSNYVSVILNILGVGVSFLSLYITYKQWKKISAKIGMLEDSGKVTEILPAWFTRRMMRENWLFGLYTVDGKVILITSIVAISDDGAWLDVELADSEAGLQFEKKLPNCIVAVDEERTRSSVRVAAIVTAVDLQSS